jgi:hypothetical protein
VNNRVEIILNESKYKLYVCFFVLLFQLSKEESTGGANTVPYEKTEV